MVAVLALVVWAIYVVDRLLDARTGLGDPGRHSLQERHWFHWRHRGVLAGLAGMASAAAGWMILGRLQAPALGRDSLIGLATLAYFSGVHGSEKPKWAEWLNARAARVVSRELLVGVIFSAGCVLPVLPQAEAGAARVCAVLVLPAAAFAALAWLNVRAIGRWETWAAGLRRETGVGWLGIGLAAACLAVATALHGREPRVGVLLALVAGSSLLLGWLDRARGRMDAVTLRAMADMVLLTPLAVVILAVR
jgi:hypothetical protein